MESLSLRLKCMKVCVFVCVSVCVSAVARQLLTDHSAAAAHDEDVRNLNAASGSGAGGKSKLFRIRTQIHILMQLQLIFCLWFVIRKCKIYLFSLSHGCSC